MRLELDESRIPPLPTVAARIMQFDPAGPTADSYSMEKLISPDQSISGEVLRIANSSYYGRSGTVRTLKEAITLLGLKTVKNLVILLTTRSMTGKIKGDLLKKHLIEFPIVCALTAIDLAKLSGNTPLQEESFLCGLLHRIGMTMIGLEKKSEYQELITRSTEGGVELSELEKTEYGITNYEVSQMVVKKWNLPDSLAQGIVGYGMTPDAIGASSDLMRITALASAVTGHMLEITPNSNQQARTEGLIAYYKLKPDLLAHYSDGYFALLKENPFYQNAVQSLN